MNNRISKSGHASTCLVVSLFVWCASALAQSDSANFKTGDRVDAMDGFNWKKATVTKVDGSSITVRFDQVNIPVEAREHMPKEMLERIRTRTLLLREVRAPKAPLAEKQFASTPTRKWSDRTGKFSIDARYAGTDGPKVVLVKTDGKKIAVPLERLSDQDRAYVKEQTDPSENPFTDTEAPAAAAGPMKEANWREAKLIQPQKFTKWIFVPTGDVAAILKTAEGPNAIVQLKTVPGADVGLNEVQGIFPSSDNRRVLVCRQKGNINEKQFLELVDILKNESEGLTPLPKQTILLDADLDAGLVAYRSNASGPNENKGVLTVAKFDSNDLTAIAQWEPYGHSTVGMNNELEQAKILSPNRILTLDRWGESIVIWDVAQVKALMKMPIGRANVLSTALSPDRKLLAIGAEIGISIIDLETGRHVATIPPDGRTYHSLAFRGDNARLAGLTDMCVKVWDLTNGKVTVDFTTAGTGTYDVALAWTGAYLLVGNNYLFDVDRRILLWEYQESMLTFHNASMRNGVLWIVPSSHDKSTLVSSPVPHPAALAMAKQLPSADEMLVAKPGDPVAIEIDMDPNVVLPDNVEKQIAGYVKGVEKSETDDGKIVMLKPGDSKKDLVRRELAIALKEAGYQVVDSSNLVLKFICKPQPQQTVLINVDGRSPARPEDFVEKPITPHATCLSFALNGEVIWENGFVAKPHMIIYLEKGETLDQALVRLSRPNMLMFSLMKFSSPMARRGKATENGAYGVSEFTSKGLIDGKNARTNVQHISG